MLGSNDLVLMRDKASPGHRSTSDRNGLGASPSDSSIAARCLVPRHDTGKQRMGGMMVTCVHQTAPTDSKLSLFHADPVRLAESQDRLSDGFASSAFLSIEASWSTSKGLAIKSVTSPVRRA